ncbi:serine hydrolase domain-containing protein [Bradyrhizobium sp. Ash2021]|uniref:serine hydrolase domain-containing protein n=1 Tax=Bradyrhizobium sp. Ash2021 TaxID=2954771 RepID=UPI002814C310|nr:serine hydrolase domain-containing protein [Bradyrhizobium sp. Ash2021]WMT74852.1 beta-lactamase family protein [Bradyrhizobium sp. Ash2021]
MTARFSRRDALAKTAAVAAANAMPGLCFPGLAAPLRALSRGSGIDAVLQKSVAAAAVPGVVAMAATAQSVIYRGAFGMRGMGAAPKLSVDSVFRIASMVKLLTSVAAMQLVEGGKLELDAPAERIDPTLASPWVLAGFDQKGTPQLRPAQKPITLRNLLSHTSGFSYQLWDPNLVRYLKLSRKDPALPRMPLTFDPGTKWAYGGSLDRVGRLVEIVSGETLDRYFHDHILAPLGMKDTGFTVTEEQRARQASLYLRKADGALVPQPIEKRTIPKVFSGGGGIYSTAPDYLTLLQALLSGGSLAGKSILRPETVALMSANQIGNIEAGIMKTTNPALSNDVDFFPGVRLRWGLGHMINLDPVREGRKAGSLTWAGLYNTYYWIDPASDIAGVIMMQILPFADARALNVYRQFEQGIYRALRPA